MTKPNTMALERIMGVPAGRLGMSYSRMLAVAGLMTTSVILTVFAAVGMVVLTFLHVNRPIFHMIPPILSLPSAFFFLVAFSVWASVHADVYAKANPLVYESHLGASFGLAIMAFIITSVGGGASAYLAFITYRSYNTVQATTVAQAVPVTGSESVSTVIDGGDVRVNMESDSSPFVIAEEESVEPHASKEYLKKAPGVVTPVVPPRKTMTPKDMPSVLNSTGTSQLQNTMGSTSSTTIKDEPSQPVKGDDIYKMDGDGPYSVKKTTQKDLQEKAHPAMNVSGGEESTKERVGTTSSQRRNISTA